MWTHLERQEGAIGTRGPGETQLETDRRHIRRKIQKLREELEAFFLKCYMVVPVLKTTVLF